MERLRPCLIFMRFGSISLVFWGVLFVAVLISTAKAGSAQADEEKWRERLIFNVYPSAVLVNQSLEIEFKAHLRKEEIHDLVHAVRLVQADADGKYIATVAEMADDGRNGDYEANDGTYFVMLTLHGSVPETRYYYVVADLVSEPVDIDEFRFTDDIQVVYGSYGGLYVNQAGFVLSYGEPKATAEKLAESVGGKIVKYWESRDRKTINYYLEIPSTNYKEQEAIVEQLRAAPKVVDAFPRFIEGLYIQ